MHGEMINDFKGGIEISFGYQCNGDSYDVSKGIDIPSLITTRRTNSSFSCLSGAALSANATLANTNICNGLIGAEILPTWDSPNSFRRIPSSPSLSRLDLLSSSLQSTMSNLSCSPSTPSELHDCDYFSPKSIAAESMESTLTTTATVTLLSLTKTLNSNSPSTPPFISRLHSLTRPNRFGSIYLPRSFGAVELHPARSRFRCLSNSAASFAPGGGGFGGNDGSSSGGGGGGDSAAEGGEAKPTVVAGGADDVNALDSDAIILDVGGMTCGGCAASVKRILESQPQVSSASVNLTTETAIVWTVSDAKDVPNWKTQLGEALAKHLTSCGFKSNLQGQGAVEGDFSS